VPIGTEVVHEVSRTSNECGSVFSASAPCVVSALNACLAVTQKPRWPPGAHLWTAPRRRTRGKTRAEVAAVTRGRGSGTTEIARTAARSAAIVPGVSTRFARARQCRRRGRGLVGATCQVAKTLAGPTKNIEDKIDVSFRSSSHAAAPAAANPTTHDGLLGSESRAQQVDAVRASPRRSAQAAHLAGTFVTQSAHFQPAAVALDRAHRRLPVSRPCTTRLPPSHSLTHPLNTPNQAALNATKVPKNGSRVVVKCRAEADDDADQGNEEFVVCVIIGGVIESCSLDLIFGGYAEFFAAGDYPVDLTGFFMPVDEYDSEDEMPVYEDDSEDSEEEDDEEDDDEDDDDDDDSEDEDDFAALEAFDEDDDDDEDEPRATKKGGVVISEIKEVEKPAGKKRKEPEAVAPKKQQDPPAAKKEKKEVPPAKKEEKKADPKKDEKKVPSEPAGKGQLKREFKNGMEIVNVGMGKPDGKIATPGKNVTMKYIGKLQSGKIFDQTKGNATFRFRLGVGEVIKGWDVGVDGMRVGDKRRLVIPPAMAYGKKGVKGAIPGGATLVFEVELVNVQ